GERLRAARGVASRRHDLRLDRLVLRIGDELRVEQLLRFAQTAHRITLGARRRRSCRREYLDSPRSRPQLLELAHPALLAPGLILGLADAVHGVSAKRRRWIAQASSDSPGISTERRSASGLSASSSITAGSVTLGIPNRKELCYFLLTISARNSRSFALMARSFAGPMRISSFCPAERPSRSASAYSYITRGCTRGIGACTTGACSR